MTISFSFYQIMLSVIVKYCRKKAVINDHGVYIPCLNLPFYQAINDRTLPSAFLQVLCTLWSMYSWGNF
jgi:hypothetical protein